MIEIKETTAWAVINPFGRNPWIMTFSLRPTRKQAIEEYVACGTESWKKLYRRGFRAIKVKVRP